MSKVYIIVNTELKMGVGKTAGQVGHAVSKLIRSQPSSKKIKEWVENCEPKIVLKGNDFIFHQLETCLKNKIYSVFDAGKTQIPSGSQTVIITEPLTDEETPDLIKNLKLL